MNSNKIKVGDFVVYSIRGLCLVKEIITRTFDRESHEYFVLAPVFDEQSTYFIPTDYDSERVHIKPALTKSEAKKLMQYAAEAEPLEWISSPNERKQTFDMVYKAGKREEKIRLIKALKQHELQQKEQGKGLYATDAKILHGCEMLIANELAYVLGKSPEEILETIE